ncbi:endonuclease, partial [Streptomyces sp. TRM76130]|nr:endonuclease [Streptomyces sp. TRM76130]
KMFNAELVEVRSPGVWEEPTAYPDDPDALGHNTECWAPVLAALSDAPVALGVEGGPVYDARVGTVSHQNLLTVLCDLRWSVPGQFSPHLEFLVDSGRESGTIDDWLVIAPMQTSRRNEARILGHGPFSLARRTRRRGSLFGAIRDPKHVPAARRLAGAANLIGNATVEQHVRPRRGALVLYPVVESAPRTVQDGSVDPRDLVMAFAFVAPPSTARGDQP